MQKWRNRNAVVTGFSGGIGKAITEALTENGVNVVGLARNAENFETSTIKNGPGKIYTRHCNVADSESVKKAFEWIEEKIGAVDILINCAGIFRFITILNDNDLINLDLEQTMETNFMGSVYCSREAYKSMVKKGNYGIIININSVGGHYVSD
jgi:NADP+-dependent farnesol dehydrogenase